MGRITSLTQRRWALKPALDPIARIERALARGLAPSSDFDLNPEVAPPAGVRAAAVLLPLIETGGGWQLVLTKRAAHLSQHAGQIALPGGRLDPGESHEQAALRESEEEIGLDPATVRLMGTLPDHHTVTGYQIRPFVGRLTDVGGVFRPQEDEVAEVFQVPLTHLLDLENFRIEGRVWHGSYRRFYTIPVGPWYIWGATARILRQLAEGCR